MIPLPHYPDLETAHASMTSPLGERWQAMQFSEYETAFPTKRGAIRVRVTASALHLMWGAGAGPQTAEGLVAANRDMIEELIAMTPPGPDGIVVISEDTITG